MSETSIAKISEDKEIPCMLLPMVGYSIILPTVTVAEMSSVKPLLPVKETPDWLLGMYEWRNTKVPVIAIDVLNGEKKEDINPNGRIAVLNGTGVTEKLPFIALHTQGIPRMARVGDKDIVEDPDGKKKPFNLMHVKVGLDSYVLPDVAALENAFIRLNLI